MPPQARRLVPLPEDPAAPATWKEYFIYTANFTGAQALAAGTVNGAPGVQVFTPLDIRIDSDSDFEFLKTVYLATDPRVYVRYVDTTSGRYLTRGALDLRAVAGIAVQTFGYATAAAPTVVAAPVETSAFMPYIWPQAHIIPAASVFEVQGADFSAATNTVRISFHGNKVRPGRAPWEVDETGRAKQYRARLPFIYGCPVDASVAAAAANGTVQASVPLDMEADFLCTAITGQYQGSATVLIEDVSGRDRRWMDTAVHIGLIAGNGLYPNRLPSPRFLYAGSTIIVTFADLSGATNRWRLYFHGVKLYRS